MKGTCAVCEILDHDTSIKDVEYCNMCGVAICAKCRRSPRRIKAFLKMKLGL